MIKCSLEEIKKEGKRNRKAKVGVYSSSFRWGYPGAHRKCWPVVVNLKLDYNKYSQELSDLEIIEKCIEFLNSPPREKYQKRQKRSAYGKLHQTPVNFKVKGVNLTEPWIQATIMTEDRTSKSFWGAGEVVSSRKKRRGKSKD